jgi:SAM-dependent methyltransferase
MTTAMKQKKVNESIRQFQRAEQLLKEQRDGDAALIYNSLIGVDSITPVAFFRLGEIENRRGNAQVAADYHRKAFSHDPKLASRITPADHPFHGYLFSDINQVEVDRCPLCGEAGIPHWAFNMVTNADFNKGFDPVRLWLFCKSCRHLFASAYPDDLDNVLYSSENEQYATPKVQLLSYFGSIVSRLKESSPGKRFMEIGVGAGEMISVANEYGLNVTGFEIRPVHADRVSNTFGVPVICEDFLKHRSSDQYDIICMGDVLEHMPDPVGAIEKAGEVISKGGLLWISTPNFESSFSVIMKDRDPMKRVCEHLNYFSMDSLRKLLNRFDFSVIDYRISAHYNGSMEVTAVKN